MDDDRSGIDRLRAAVEDVATTLGSPSSHQRPRRTRNAVAGAGIAFALVIVVAVSIYRVSPGRPEAEAGARLGIEVRELRLGGRTVDARVFDAAGAGTIVVAPRTRPEGD